MHTIVVFKFLDNILDDILNVYFRIRDDIINIVTILGQ